MAAPISSEHRGTNVPSAGAVRFHLNLSEKKNSYEFPRQSFAKNAFFKAKSDAKSTSHLWHRICALPLSSKEGES
jgi:hypothetical protein